MTRSAILPILVLALAGCATVSDDIAIQVSDELLVSQQRYQTSYIVNPGDSLEVVVERIPDLGRTVVVRSDGAISLPRVGDLKVGGLTVDAAAETIQSALAQRLIDPQVDVIVQNPPVPQIYVTGEVGRSLAIPLREVVSAADAIVVAGGALRSAKLNQVALIRLDEDGYIRARIIRNADSGVPGMLVALRSVSLKAGDIVVVQESNRSQFARFLQDFISTPLSAANAIISPYVQLELLREINSQ